MYDIIFLGEKNDNWRELKERFPTAKYAATFADAHKMIFTKMYWLIFDDVRVDPTFNFDYKVEEYDMEFTHIFGEIFLFNKKKHLSKNEIKYRFFVRAKHINCNSSIYDVIFISYDEPNADKNYQELLKIRPDAKRIHGIKGIHQAHIEAAAISTTRLFWIVDADALIVNEFDFRITVPIDTKVRVWRSKNPINGLVYGYGGIKLFPCKQTLMMNPTRVDMTTSISDHFELIDVISNITEFNTDEFSTWKSAFRECVKLSSKIIPRQQDDETTYRLTVWMTKGIEQPYGKYCIDGARDGESYGKTHRGNSLLLNQINDFAWLKRKFDERYN